MINPGSVAVALLALLALLIAPVNSPTVDARDSDRGVPVAVAGGSGCTMYYTDGDSLPDGLTCIGDCGETEECDRFGIGAMLWCGCGVNQPTFECSAIYEEGHLPLIRCNGALLCLPGNCEKNDAEPGRSYRICSCQ